MKVGIWCAYHVTLEPSEGIGVFAHNLARGIAGVADGPTVHMVCNTHDSGLMRQTVDAGRGRIQVIELPGPPKMNKQRMNRFFAREMKNAERRVGVLNAKTWPQVHFDLGLRLFGRDPHIPRPPASPIDLVLTPATAVCWSGYRAVRRVNRVWQNLAKLGYRRTRRAAESTSFDLEEEIERIVQACDVWILPYVGLDRKFSKPTVVTIHDLVCYHFPETLSPDSLEIFKRISTKVSQQSTVSACMSNFIKENDLIGILNLPDDQIRVIEPAAPSDFGKLMSKRAAASKYPVIIQPYIFYPSAFRAYKNHEALVEALNILAQRGNQDLQLVFTGIHAPAPRLVQLIDRYGLESRVHILGKTDRAVLSALYSNAMATIVPSLYEQGSYPLMEAMHWGCPIACSGIPALRELLAAMGDQMLFFDPHNYTQIADKIDYISANREEVRASQQQCREAILGRTWTAAAQDWIEVLEYAQQRFADQQLSRAGPVAPELALTADG